MEKIAILTKKGEQKVCINIRIVLKYIDFACMRSQINNIGNKTKVVTNMTKFKHILTILLVLAMCLAIGIVAVACKTEEEKEPETNNETGTETEKETLLIANGRFSEYNTDSDTVPYAPTSWTGNNISKDNTATTISGIVPMDKTKFDNLNTNWDNLIYPGSNKEKEEEGDYALMIYNKTANAYSYSPTTTFSTTVGSYYKFTVDLMVIAGAEPIAEGSGAYVTFSGAAYHSFGPYGVTEGWKTITFYVAASELKAQSITITLSLGAENNTTTGYAFFDDMLANKLTADKYAKEIAQLSGNDAATYSMLVPDGDFINVVGTSEVKTDYIWSGASGKGNGSDSNASYVKTGIISTDTTGWDAWKDLSTLEVDNVGTPHTAKPTEQGLSTDANILAISNQYALASVSKYEEAFTSYGYTNTLGMNIAPRTIYKLSVWVYTDLNTVEQVNSILANRNIEPEEGSTITHTTYGANILMSGLDGVFFKNINTAKTWQCYTFYVFGDDEDYKTINVELWLGEGGMSDNTRANGTVYFDNVRLETMAEALSDRATQKANYTNDYVTPGNGQVLIVDLQDTSVQLIANSNFDAKEGTEYTLANWTVERQNGILESDVDVKTAVLDTTAEIDDNPLAPYGFNPVLMLKHINPTASYVRNIASVEVVQNLHYQVSIWIKTDGIKSGSGVTIALMNADGDASLSSFTTVNTDGYENDMPNVNGYAHYQFYVKGSSANNETTPNDSRQVYIQISFGEGNNFSTTSYLAGTVYIADISMRRISESAYTNASTGTYIKKYQFATTTGSTTGAFADGNFDAYNDDESKIDDTTGTQTDLYKPSGWTISTVDNVKSGILNTNQPYAATVLAAAGVTDDIYNGWANGVTNDIKDNYKVNFAAPNLFVAYTTDAVTACKLLKNTSSVSLSKDSYYIISAYVRAVGVVGELEFSTESNTDAIVVPFGSTNAADSAWEEITFAVHTGSFGSVNGYLTMYMGNYTADKALETKPTYTGAIFMDAVSCRTVDAKEYTAFVSNTGKNNGNGVTDNNYITYTFDTSSTETTIHSVGSTWSGTGSSHSKVVGIYNKDYTVTELTYVNKTTDDEGTETKTTDEAKTIDKNKVFDLTGLDSDVIGKGVLVINNQEAGYYAYNSVSLSLAAGKSYRIAVLARTFNIAQGEYALLRLTADTEYDIIVNSEYTYKVDAEGNYIFEDNKHTYTQAASAWHQYVFYIQNNKSSAQTATLKLMLGQSATEAGTENSAPVQGTALFDNVSMEEIETDAFIAQYKKLYQLDEENNVMKDEEGNELMANTGRGRYLLYNNAIRMEDDYTPEKEEEDNKDDNKDDETKTDSSLIWLYITSIVIAAMLIVVIVVWIINRNKKSIKAFFAKFKKSKKKVDYSREDVTEDKKSKGEPQNGDDNYND